MIAKAEKYYKLLTTIRKIRQELRDKTVDMSPEEEVRKIWKVVQSYRALGDLENCVRFLDMYIENGMDDEDIVDCYIRMKEITGRYYVRKNDLKLAIEAFEGALFMAEKYELDFKIMDMYQSLSNIYEKKGDYRRALKYYDEYSKLSAEAYQEKNYAYSKYLIEVYGLDDISQETRRVIERNRDLGIRANVDSLTGVYNRRFLHDELAAIIADGVPSCRVGAIMMDIDFFKQYNDLYGHAGGDKVLRTIGEILRSVTNERVYPIRYGGEEFLIVIKEPAEGETVRLVEQIMELLRLKKIEHKGSQVSKQLTISAGIAEGRCADYDEIYRLSEQADRMLYEAKHRGRNRWLKDED